MGDLLLSDDEDQKQRINSQKVETSEVKREETKTDTSEVKDDSLTTRSVDVTSGIPKGKTEFKSGANNIIMPPSKSSTASDAINDEKKKDTDRLVLII